MEPIPAESAMTGRTQVRSGDVESPARLQDAIDFAKGGDGIVKVFENVAESHRIEPRGFELQARKHPFPNVEAPITGESSGDGVHVDSLDGPPTSAHLDQEAAVTAADIEEARGPRWPW